MAKGSWEFVSYKDRVVNELDQVAVKAMTAILEMIKSAVKANAPTDTGQLRNSIDYQLKAVNGRVVGIVGSPLQYALYVEFGTGEFAENGGGRKGGWVYQDPSGEWFFTWGQEPQSFMRDAFRQYKGKIKEILGSEYGASFKGGK